MERNKTAFYYCLYKGKKSVVDENEDETGETQVVYSEPFSLMANISPATGNTSVEQFGNSLQYDKVIVVDDVSCQIDEYTALFIDKSPAFDVDGVPLFDYIVKKVARSLNSVSIAISKVEVS